MKIYVTINGLKALALVGTGSTINAVSPDFARVAGLKPFSLADPVGLQLGCAGSRSKINYGAQFTCRLADTECSMYADVVHLDHYDVVLGGPFCVAEGIILDYPAWLVRYGRGLSITPLAGEGQAVTRVSRVRPAGRREAANSQVTNSRASAATAAGSAA